jgi:RNA polymerase sigma factor (sigma-70 family)
MTPLLAQRPRTDRAFERLYRRHVGDVYRYALAVMRNPADAEDVTQTAFLNAYRAYERGERPETPHNWLIAIAHNVCRQRFRHNSRRPHEVAFEDEVAETIVDEDEGPSAEDIRRALGDLAFNQRAALVMRELEGRSYAEIAEILDLSVAAVETLIFRARRALREQLEGALTCRDAELAISKQLDGRLSRSEKGSLRAHLRQCKECESFARSQRAQRSALKALGAVPVPASLASFFGGGSAVAGGTTAVAVKAAVVLAGAIVAGTAGYAGYEHSAAPGAPAVLRAHAPASRASAVIGSATPRRAPARVVRARAHHRPAHVAHHHASAAAVAAHTKKTRARHTRAGGDLAVPPARANPKNDPGAKSTRPRPAIPRGRGHAQRAPQARHGGRRNRGAAHTRHARPVSPPASHGNGPILAGHRKPPTPQPKPVATPAPAPVHGHQPPVPSVTLPALPPVPEPPVPAPVKKIGQ